mgnify:CR=1 FL=1
MTGSVSEQLRTGYYCIALEIDFGSFSDLGRAQAARDLMSNGTCHERPVLDYFPVDLFTEGAAGAFCKPGLISFIFLEEKEKGAIVLHLICMIYCFLAYRLIIHERLLPALR